MNTADLHPKRLPLRLTIAQLRRLSAALLQMEGAPHDGEAGKGHGLPPEKQLEWDRAGEQLIAHVSSLVQETRDQDPAAPLTDSVPLLRAGAKFLLTACDRCRREALQALLRGDEAGAAEVRGWDAVMREIGAQHGLTSPLRHLVPQIQASAADLARVGIAVDELFCGPEMLR